MKKIKNIIYLAGVVIDSSNLKKLINSNMPNIYCHHMTVKYGEIDKLPSFLGFLFKFRTNKIFFNEKAVAVSGEIDSPLISCIMEEAKQNAHITICTEKDIAPVYSNELLTVGSSIEYRDEVMLKFGAFVVFEDNTTGWIFDSSI